MSKRFNIYDEYREKFYRLPKVFFTNEKYTVMSNDAKLAWAILQDRLELSQKNKWIDDNGDYYFIYTNKNLEQILNCGKSKVISIKKELIDAELLEQVKQGLNKPNILYLNKPEVTNKDIYAIDNDELIDKPSRSKEVRKSDFQENEDKPSSSKEVRKSDFQKSEIRTSRIPKIGLQESRNKDPNDTDFSDTDFSDFKEEEINNTRTREENMAYAILSDYLKKNNIDKKTINLVIEELINRKIDIFLMKDVEKQFSHMMDKLTYGEVENHNGFSTYFVNGLQMRISQTKANRQYQEEKLREYELVMQKNKESDENKSVYFNWLNGSK